MTKKNFAKQQKSKNVNKYQNPIRLERNTLRLVKKNSKKA